MKAHRWYSAFRNVGIWAICVVIAWVVIPGLIDYPQRYSALDLMSLIGLMVLPLAFLVGVIFPFRISRTASLLKDVEFRGSDLKVKLTYVQTRAR